MKINPGRHLGLQCAVIGISGVFLIIVALFGSGFFFDHPRAKSMTYLLGREGARAFCGVVGLFLVFLSFWLRLAFTN